LILVRGKGTADMAKNLCRSSSQRLKMFLHIGEQHLKSAAVMIMRHGSSPDAPEPFNAVGIRIIRRRIHQISMVLELGVLSLIKSYLSVLEKVS
jgi:hypothetical protein